MLLGEEHVSVAVTEHEIGRVLLQQGKLEEAEKLFKLSLDKVVALGDDHPYVLPSRLSVLVVQRKLRKLP